jgi:phosphate starvation-inducible protein PhoH
MKKKQRQPVSPNNMFSNVKKMEPLTETHSLVIQAHEKKRNTVIYGYPGTGKTYLACACAIDALMNNEQSVIRIIRSAVPSRDMGFLPGTEDEKMAAYERPYIGTINNIMRRGDAYGLLKSKGLLTFESSSFLRGMTYDDSFIIVDEFQNMSLGEINTIVTRIGENSRIMICGDVTQTDLRETETGYSKAMRILTEVDDFDMIHMDADDIVRSDLVRRWILASEKVK